MRKNLDTVTDPRSHHYTDRRITPSGTIIAGLTALMCGVCDRLMSRHPYADADQYGEHQVPCNRQMDDFGYNEHDYYRHGSSLGPSGITFHEDFSGPGTDERILPDFQRNLANEDEYVSVDVELRALDAWHDKATDRCTLTLEQHQARPDITEARFYQKADKNGLPDASFTYVPDSIYIEPEMRQAFIEGNDAFFSLKVLDPELTKKYHARLLNWFLDKNTAEVRVGSMRFFINADGERCVQCVRSCTKDANGNWYKPGTRIDSHSDSRASMEAFIYEVIRHGNNCAASFIKNRPDWYRMEPLLPVSASVTANETEEFNEVEFLFDHQQYCNDARCKCAERIAELVPGLAKESA